MNRHASRAARSPRRVVSLAVMMTALLLGSISPARAAASGTFISGPTNPGSQTHVGVLTGVPPTQEPCAIFTSYTYTVNFPTVTGSVTVGSTTFTTAQATVNSAPGSRWAENGGGTYSYGPDPLPTCPPEGGATEAIPGFSANVVGANAAGDTVRCVAGTAGSGTYQRTDLDIAYDFADYTCTVNGTSTETNVDLNFDVDLIVVVPDPGYPPYPYGNITACTSPMHPTGCLSRGTLTLGSPPPADPPDDCQFPSVVRGTIGPGQVMALDLLADDYERFLADPAVLRVLQTVPEFADKIHINSGPERFGPIQELIDAGANSLDRNNDALLEPVIGIREEMEAAPSHVTALSEVRELMRRPELMRFVDLTLAPSQLLHEVELSLGPLDFVERSAARLIAASAVIVGTALVAAACTTGGCIVGSALVGGAALLLIGLDQATDTGDQTCF